MGGPLKNALLFDNFNMVTFIMQILLILILYFCIGNSSNITTNLNFMKVFLLVFENLDPEDSGVLAMYSNMDAANEALLYAQSLNKYFRLRIDVSFVDDKFFKSDFD